MGRASLLWFLVGIRGSRKARRYDRRHRNWLPGELFHQGDLRDSRKEIRTEKRNCTRLLREYDSSSPSGSFSGSSAEFVGEIGSVRELPDRVPWPKAGPSTGSSSLMPDAARTPTREEYHWTPEPCLEDSRAKPGTLLSRMNHVRYSTHNKPGWPRFLGLPRSISGLIPSCSKRAAPQPAGGGGGVHNGFRLRTARVSSAPTESSHTASAAMFGQFGRICSS
jgi:hypothetical protein